MEASPRKGKAESTWIRGKSSKEKQAGFGVSARLAFETKSSSSIGGEAEKVDQNGYVPACPWSGKRGFLAALGFYQLDLCGYPCVCACMQTRPTLHFQPQNWWSFEPPTNRVPSTHTHKKPHAKKGTGCCSLGAEPSGGQASKLESKQANERTNKQTSKNNRTTPPPPRTRHVEQCRTSTASGCESCRGTTSGTWLQPT